ncbi:MAG: MFS transporter [Planctomycetota bacterium]|nr:MFS transporter [Planctomycetota bacterium]
MLPGRRNFRAVWLALFTTSLGLMAFLPVLALYVEEEFGITDPKEVALWASVIYGAGPFSAACMGPIWGAMGDRYGKKRMAVRANAAIAVTTALMPLATTPTWLLALRVLQGAFAGFVAPAMALVTGHLPKYVHGRIIARLQVAMALGSFVGPYIGAELTSWFGRAALFWVASAAAAFSALRLLVSAEDSPPAPQARAETFFGGFRSGVADLLGNRAFAILLGLLLVLRLGQNMLEPMLSLFVRDLGPQAWIAAWSASEALALDRTIAVAFGVLAIGQWCFTPLWGRMADRRGPLRCLMLLSFGLFVAQGLMSMVTSIDQFLLLRVVVACLMAGSLTLAFSSVSKRVADERRTLALALVQSCIQLGLAFGPLLGTAVAATAGGTDFRRAFATAACLCGAAGVGMVWLRRRERLAG